MAEGARRVAGELGEGLLSSEGIIGRRIKSFLLPSFSCQSAWTIPGKGFERRVKIIGQLDAGHRAKPWACRRGRLRFVLRLRLEEIQVMQHLAQLRFRLLGDFGDEELPDRRAEALRHPKPPAKLAFGLDMDCGSLLPLFRGSPAAAKVSRPSKSLSAAANARAPRRNISWTIRRPAGWPPESGSRLPQSMLSTSLAIFGGDFIEGEAGDGLHPRLRRLTLEGCGTAPLPL